MSTTRSTHQVLGVYRETDGGVQLTRLVSRLTLLDLQTEQSKTFPTSYSEPYTENKETHQDINALRRILFESFPNDPQKNEYVDVKLIAEKESPKLATDNAQQEVVTVEDDVVTDETSPEDIWGSSHFSSAMDWYVSLTRKNEAE